MSEANLSGTSKIFQALVKELARIYYSWLERRVPLGRGPCSGVWARARGGCVRCIINPRLTMNRGPTEFAN